MAGIPFAGNGMLCCAMCMDKDRNALSDAVTVAFQHDNKVIIEKAVDGFEVGCAVLGNDSLAIGEVHKRRAPENAFRNYGDEQQKRGLIGN